MITRIHAIFRNGVFIPSTPPPVAEGTEVELMVTTDASRSLVNELKKIAALPIEGAQDGFSGLDHDNILYGRRTDRLV